MKWVWIYCDSYSFAIIQTWITIMLDKSFILGIKCQKLFMYGDEIMYQYIEEQDICASVWWALPKGNAQMQQQ